MPGTARASEGGLCYHVPNRGNVRSTNFYEPGDDEAFLAAVTESAVRVPVRLLAYCSMPNHVHLVAWPVGVDDLSRWTHWLMNTHVRRYLTHYDHSGHVWQGRFKAFPIQDDGRLLTVLRRFAIVGGISLDLAQVIASGSPVEVTVQEKAEARSQGVPPRASDEELCDATSQRSGHD